MIGGDVLEDLSWGEGCFVLDVFIRMSSNRACDVTHFVVAEEPEPWCLVVLVVAHVAVVRPNLQQVLPSCRIDLRSVQRIGIVRLVALLNSRARVYDLDRSIVFFLL